MARRTYAYWSIVTAITFLSPSPSQADLEVCPTCAHTQIQSAISAAKDNETITVKEGTYFENNLKITRPLSLVAQGKVIIDGKDQGAHLFHILAPQVTLAGFTLRNTGNSYLQEFAGVRVTLTWGCTLRDNRFENTTYGIYLENSKQCLIQDNVFRGVAKDEASGGNGIHSWQGEGIVVQNNDIQGHRDGIYFEFVKNATVANNRVAQNLRYGLHYMSSNDCAYQNNTFMENGAGVAVMYSRRIQMTHNRFLLNRGVAAYGLLMKEIHEGLISENDFGQNTVGVFMEGSNRNRFTRNLWSENGWALRIMGDCENNQFEQNTIASNTFDVATNSEYNPNRFDGNYWSQYNGYDLDHDGKGDVPYRPVSLSSVILENVDSSFILTRSPLFTLLDEIERSLPELIPERMKDEHPLMRATR